MNKIIIAIMMISSSSFSYSHFTTNKNGSIKSYFKKVSLKRLKISKTDRDSLGLSLDVVKALSKRHGLNINIEDIRLLKKQTSLRGVHYTFNQYSENRKVYGSHFTVTMTHNHSHVLSFYSTLTASKTPSTDQPIDALQAHSLAWNKTNFKGTLSQMPSSELVYKEIGDELRLVYKVNFLVKNPSSHWSVDVDAISGKVLSETNKNIYRKNFSSKSKLNFKAKTSFNDAIKSLSVAKKTQAPIALLPNYMAQGSAFVFMPNPVTTLMRDDLQDYTPAAEFEQAYSLQTLNGLTVKDDGKYYLENDNLKIIDFESPRTAPSTTDNGVWTAKRGDIAFNDVMTYHHLNTSMNYLKNIGYNQDKNIFPMGIEVDTNAVFGDDNSYFRGFDNVLAFGHGCVDDNEDSDVILHELGHAIQHNINTNFNGGDTGAIGEGFGDYWAASYSYMQENGDYKSDWVFKWDGHNDCWGGRKLNATAIYDHETQYDAHAFIINSQDVTDELWSTPIFQAFKEMIDNNVATYDEIQKVIIESHYGLGYNVKMRDLATATVTTAKTLFPSKKIHKVLAKHFVNHNILE